MKRIVWFSCLFIAATSMAQAPAVELQKRMTAVVTYLVGGPSPTTAFACVDSGRSIEGLSRLRTRIADGTCTLEPGPPTTVHGLKAGVKNLSCTGLAAADLAAIECIAASVDRCWHAGARDFFIVGDSRVTDRDDGNYDLRMAIDPEPVTLNGSLSGNESAAPATYANSGGFVWAYQFPSSWAVSSLPPGTPCANYAAPAGATLYGIIVADGNYRKCDEILPSPPRPPCSQPSPTEAARLTQDLSGSQAAAVFVDCGSSTLVVRWPATWSVSTLAAGTVCSPIFLKAGQETAQRIQAMGNYRKCG